MNRILFLPALSLFISLSVSAQQTMTKSGEDCDSSARHTLITCPGEEAEALDKKLAKAVRLQRELIQQQAKSVGLDADEVVAQFDTANEHWLKMRDEECAWRGRWFHGDSNHMASSQVIRCTAGMTLDRLKQVQAGGMYGPGEKSRPSTRGYLQACGDRPRETNKADESRYKDCYLTLENGLELELNFRKTAQPKVDELSVSWDLWPVEGDSMDLGAYSAPHPEVKTPQGVDHYWKIEHSDLDNDGISEVWIPLQFHRPFLMQIALLTADRSDVRKVADLYSLKPLRPMARLRTAKDEGGAVVLLAEDKGQRYRLHVLHKSQLYPSVVVVDPAGSDQCIRLAETDSESGIWVKIVRKALARSLPKTLCQ